MTSRTVSAFAFYIPVLVVLTSGSSSFSSPAGQEADGPIQKAKLVSPSHGWALAGGRLLWTDNNGLQWNDIIPQLSAGEEIDAVYFSDNHHAWTVIRQPSETGTAKLYVGTTSNGGSSWTKQPIAEGDTEMLDLYGNSGDISFADSLTGWTLLAKISSSAASRAGLFFTRDGGSSWSRLPDPPINGSIRFISPQTGWLCGGVLGNELYVTRDGGRTWQRRMLEPPSEVQKAYRTTYYTPVFHDPNHGFAAATFDIPKTMFGGHEISFLIASYETSDGGDTWTLQSVQKRSHRTTVAIFDSTVFDALDADNAIVVGNQTARRVGALPAGLSPQHFDIEDADFIDPENGWVLLSHDRGCHKPGCINVSALIGTEDGGKTLTLLLRNTRVNPSSQAEFGSPVFTPSVTPGPGGVSVVNSAYGMDACGDMEGLVGDLVAYADATGALVVGFYLGGATASAASCWVPYPPSEDPWLVNMTCNNWDFEPIWDDLQAPCTGLSHLISTNAATAAAQGTASADAASSALAARDLQNSIAYLDIEAYSVPAGNTTCSPAVRSYVSAWVAEMHRNGNQAGVYGSPTDILADMGPGAVSNVPDQIWGALYNNQANSNLPPIPNPLWAYQQRTHQYAGNQQLAYMPTSFRADLDWVSGVAAYYSNKATLCQGACTNPCNPACPDYDPGNPECSGPPTCNCYDCEGEGGGPACCCNDCDLQCGG